MKPEQIAKTRAQAIACANAVNECRIRLAQILTTAEDQRAYDLEMDFWRLAQKYEAARGAKK